MQQMVLLDASYHGGIVAYLHNAKQLLADSKEGAWLYLQQQPLAATVLATGWHAWLCYQPSCSAVIAYHCVRCLLSRAANMLAAGKNAFDGYIPSVPEGERLDFGSSRFLDLEGQGLKAAGYAAFVLVAGGLGERLGYQGVCWL